jgi:hypothetical protein
VLLLLCVPESSKARRRENAGIVAVTAEAIRSHHLHRRTIQSNWQRHDDQDGSNGAKVVLSNKTLSCQEMMTRINVRPEASWITLTQQLAQRTAKWHGHNQKNARTTKVHRILQS